MLRSIALGLAVLVQILSVGACSGDVGTSLTQPVITSNVVPSGVSAEARGATQAPFQSCINIAADFETGADASYRMPTTRSDIDIIAAAGFEAIRLPVRWTTGRRVDARGFVSPTFFAELDYIVDYALDAGLQIIIDVHHYSELSLNPNGEEQRFLQIWRDISAHYQDRSQNLIFEVLNEPFLDFNQPANNRLDIARIDRLNAGVLEIIRQNNPNRWVILGGGQFGNLDGGQGQGLISSNPPRDNNVMLTFHYYSPFNFTHQGAEFTDCFNNAGNPIPCVVPVGWGSAADRNAVRQDMAVAGRFRDDIQMPVLLGEFGVHGPRQGGGAALSLRADWMGEVRRSAESNSIAWCAFDYQSSFPAFDFVTQSWFQSILNALFG